MRENPLDEMMQEGLRGQAYPGAVLLVGKGDDVLHFNAYGNADLFSGRLVTRDTCFDLASLTKPLATTLALAKLVDQRLLSLEAPAADFLSAMATKDKKKITLRQLLCHTSGFPAHRRFYMPLKKIDQEDRKNAILKMLGSTPLECPPGNRRIYSDLGFMLLCRVIESVAGCSIDHFLRAEVYDTMDLSGLFFVGLHPRARPDLAYAATELCPIRNRLLIGEVHDDNAWFAGGVDGHAGLFGSADAVFQLLRGLVDDLNGGKSSFVFSSKVLSEIFQLDNPRQYPLGFDRPSLRNSSAGRYFSQRTVGHLGYTGVSFWMDLDKDVSVILLTNRVHPTRWNNRLARLRPMVHDQIMEHFEFV